jgi:Leucine-rich repeat (LRR) protein
MYKYFIVFKLDTSGDTNLEEISLDNNKIIPKLDFSQNSSMKILAMPNIALGETSGYMGPGGYFDLSNLTQLEILGLGINNLTSIDLSDNENLQELELGGNNISEIDISHLVSLTKFDISQSPITSLDLSSNTQLGELGL